MSEEFLARCNLFLEHGEIRAYTQCIAEYNDAIVRGKVTDLSKKVADGTATEEEKTQFHIFAPLLIPVQPITIEKLLLGILLVRYAKDEKGRGQLKEIAIKYLDVIGDSMRALARASASHWSVAAMNTKVTLRVYKNLGLMTPDEAAGLEVWINQYVLGLAATEVIGNISSVGTMLFGGKGVPALTAPTVPGA